MKIIDVNAHLLAIPLKQEEFPASWAWGRFNQIIVQIKTDEGITGIGEAFGYGSPEATVSVIHQILRPMLIGADPTSISLLHDKMYRQTHFFGRYGITTFAISGIDIALWDIAAKCAGLPLYRLFGGTGVTTVPAYASLTRYSQLEDLKFVARHAQQAGFPMIKLHQLDVASIRTVRETLGQAMPLALDVNCAWDPEKARQMARQLLPYDLLWLEEPIWPPEDYRSLAKLGQLGGIPLAAGENACTVYPFQEMLAVGAATYIQPSVVKVGGISEWRKVAVLAETFNVKVAPHSPYFGPGFLATAHLLASTSYVASLEYLYFNLEAGIFTQPLKFENGSFCLPQGPGIGLEIDWDVVTCYAIKGER